MVRVVIPAEALDVLRAAGIVFEVIEDEPNGEPSEPMPPMVAPQQTEGV